MTRFGPGYRVGRGNDTIFTTALSDAMRAFLGTGSGTVTPPTGGGTNPPGTGGGTNPGQTVQPKILLAQWEADAPGTVDIDTSLGVPVITTWRDKISGIALIAPTISQAPVWLSTSQMASGRPALSFDGFDDVLSTVALNSKFSNLQGITASMLIANDPAPTNTVDRILWVENSVAGPRFGYARSGVGPDQFYMDGETLDTDARIPFTGSVYPYDGWASHVVRRDYLGGTARVDFNGGMKASVANIATINYGDSKPATVLQLGTESKGQNAGAFRIYGLKIYTYAISADEMSADATYYGGRINA